MLNIKKWFIQHLHNINNKFGEVESWVNDTIDTTDLCQNVLQNISRKCVSTFFVVAIKNVFQGRQNT